MVIVESLYYGFNGDQLAKFLGDAVTPESVKGKLLLTYVSPSR